MGENLGNWAGEKLKWISGLAWAPSLSQFWKSLPTTTPRKGWLNVARLALHHITPHHSSHMCSIRHHHPHHQLHADQSNSRIQSFHHYQNPSTNYHQRYGLIGDQCRKQTRANLMRENKKCSKLHFCHFLIRISPLCNLDFHKHHVTWNIPSVHCECVNGIDSHQFVATTKNSQPCWHTMDFVNSIKKNLKLPQIVKF